MNAVDTLIVCDPGGILTHENRAVGQMQSGTKGVAENKAVRGAEHIISSMCCMEFVRFFYSILRDWALRCGRLAEASKRCRTLCKRRIRSRRGR